MRCLGPLVGLGIGVAIIFVYLLIFKLIKKYEHDKKGLVHYPNMEI